MMLARARVGFHVDKTWKGLKRAFSWDLDRGSQAAESVALGFRVLSTRKPALAGDNVSNTLDG